MRKTVELGEKVRINLPVLLLAFQAAFMLFLIEKNPYMRSSEMALTPSPKCRKGSGFVRL